MNRTFTCAAALLLGLSLAACNSAPSGPNGNSAYGNPEVGKGVPNFVLPGLDGSSVNLSDYKGKVIYLDFWASWCEPCLRALPEVEQLWSDYRDEDFVILGVSLDYSRSTWRDFVAKEGIDWEHVYDDGSNNGAVNVFGVQYIPQTFLIDKEGVLVATNARSDVLRIKIDEALGR